MKIAAGLILRNEADRYLGLALENLLEFVDVVAVVDDGSTDGWEDLIPQGAPVVVAKIEKTDRDGEREFYRHADARNLLLKCTLATDPDWVVASDADELWTDGQAIRRTCETARTDVVTVDIAEVWEVCDDCLCTREDGGWRTHPIGAVWRAETFRRQALSLTDKDTATGRVPDAVHRKASTPSGSALLHLGWSCEVDRAERHKRHVGSSHAGTHVQSILWSDQRVKLAAREWPVGWSAETRGAVMARANRG